MSRPKATCWLCGGDATIDDVYRSVGLHRCTNCGFLFAPERGSEELRELYGDEYFEQYPGGESYDEDEPQRRFEAQVRRDWIRGYVSSGSLLEIGAAAGYFLDEMRLAGYTVCGVEPADGFAEMARSGLSLDVRTGFIEDVELPGDDFDIVCAWHVLEHLSRPKAALDRLRSSVRDDGWLFLEIPNIESVKAKQATTEWFNLDPRHHVAFYDRVQLKKLLADSGFKLQETQSVSGFSYLRAGRAVMPKQLAARTVESARTRTIPGRPHPWKHELLRAVARPA